MKKRPDGRYLKVVTINGKRVYFYSTEDTEKKAAKDIERQMIAFKEKKTDGNFFENVADEWFKSIDEKVSETTVHRYKSLVEHCKGAFSDMRMENIDTKMIEMFLSKLSHKGLSTKTIKSVFSVLSMIFRYNIINNSGINDPCRYLSLPKGKPSVAREALEAAEQKTVNESIDKPFGLFAYFLMYTGMRRGEAIAIKYSDIDFENKTICVQRSVVFADNTPIIKSPKTEAGKRKIVLLDCLAEKLEHKNTDEYIFGIPRGNSWYTRQWKKYQEATGLTVTPHQLRHTFATILYEANISDKDAQMLMGHSDITTTRNIYTHIRNSRMQQTTRQLNSFLDGKNDNEN